MDADTQEAQPRKPKVGRPSKYKPSYCRRLLEYFDKPPFRTTIETYKTKAGTIIEKEVLVPAEPPFLTDFAKEIGVSRQQLHVWAKEHRQFFDAIARAKELQEEMIAKNGLLKL